MPHNKAQRETRVYTQSTCLHCSHVDFSTRREQQEGSLAVPSFLHPCAVLVGRNKAARFLQQSFQAGASVVTTPQRDELSARAFSEATDITGIVMDSGDVMDSYSL